MSRTSDCSLFFEINYFQSIKIFICLLNLVSSRLSYSSVRYKKNQSVEIKAHKMTKSVENMDVVSK